MIVAQGTLAREPEVTIDRADGRTTVRLAGPWTAPHAQRVEALLEEIAADVEAFPLILDLRGVERLDTLGARLRESGVEVRGPIDFQTGRRSYLIEDPEEHTIELTDL